ncbi:MAG TPA: hypothetical protein VF826_20050 [Chloroflexia bacterium]|jgi:hypothetical protein
MRERGSWKEVRTLESITGTSFPDIKNIHLSGDANSRPAEVKFTTSLFNYHREGASRSKFEDFALRKGFILVVKHDSLPVGIDTGYDIDVYEIDSSDFIAFCRENFARLLNRQIKERSGSKVWLMYQGPNFNQGDATVRPARDSFLWCPTENLNIFDLAIGDRILFVKTSGASTQKVQASFLASNLISTWKLREICVCEVSSRIRSRYDYCHLEQIPFDRKLWKNDPRNGTNWRWNRVFKFRIVSTITGDLPIRTLYDIQGTRAFASALAETFTYGRSREISLDNYVGLLEVLAGMQDQTAAVPFNGIPTLPNPPRTVEILDNPSTDSVSSGANRTTTSIEELPQIS